MTNDRYLIKRWGTKPEWAESNLVPDHAKACYPQGASRGEYYWSVYFEQWSTVGGAQSPDNGLAPKKVKKK